MIAGLILFTGAKFLVGKVLFGKGACVATKVVGSKLCATAGASKAAGAAAGVTKASYATQALSVFPSLDPVVPLHYPVPNFVVDAVVGTVHVIEEGVCAVVHGVEAVAHVVAHPIDAIGAYIDAADAAGVKIIFPP